MVFEQLANAVLSFVNWGITIVVIMLIWEIIQFIRGGTEDRGESKLTDWESNPVLNKLGWTKKAKAAEKVRHAASREETAMLNEYVEEKKELELLDDAVTQAQEFFTMVAGAAKSSKIDEASLKSKFKEVDTAVKKAGKETDKLKRNTWRERRKMKELYKSLGDAGVSKGELDKLRSLEDLVLKSHVYVITNLASAAAAINRGNSMVTGLAKSKTKVLTTLRELFYKEVIPMLQNAQGGQRSAYKDTEALIAKIRAVWK